MKTITALLFLPLFLRHVATGFIPTSQPRSSVVRAVTKSSKSRDEIAHELEDLGDEIKHQVMRNDVIHGFDEIHETEVHKLRKRVRDLKHQWQKDRAQLAAIEERIVHLEEALEKDRIEWETEENKLLSEMFEHEKEEGESFRKLFGKIFKLAGRRIKNGFKRLFRSTHRFP